MAFKYRKQKNGGKEQPTLRHPLSGLKTAKTVVKEVTWNISTKNMKKPTSIIIVVIKV